MKESNKDQYLLKSLDSALTVLQLFERGEALSPAQAAQRSGMNRTVVFRILHTLEQRGYLFLEEDGRYAPGVRLAALGARVTVAARSPGQRALAMSQGLAAAPMEAVDGLLESTDVAVNTVPAPVLDARRLGLLPKDALVIDLASLPGGTDFEVAKELGVRAIHALSLPARCAPVTAGQFVAQTVLAMLRERGEGI